MRFEIVGPILNIETIAVGRAIRVLPMLQRRYGKGRWRKLKGVANVRLNDGTIRLAEVHWFQAHDWKEKDQNQTLFRLESWPNLQSVL